MDDFIALESELAGAVFLISLSALLVWEQLWPRRRVDAGRGRRWTVNFGVFFTAVVVRILLNPITAVALAVLARERGYGLFNVVDGPPAIVFLVAVLAMDFANYGQHVLMHKIPLLWRVHRVHHADPAFDVTTSLRFHHLELFVGTAVDLAVIVAVGAPVGAVLTYRLARGVLSASAHGNICLPARADSLVRRLVVTPDVHRVHHSQLIEEQNCNFAGGLMCWDYLFGTYRAQPKIPHEKMDIGLQDCSVKYASSLGRMLLEPFFKQRVERTK